MKLICISDTHGLHKQITVPDGDMLIHAGDMSMSGATSEVSRFSSWLSLQPHKYKILIAGNHDFAFENSYKKAVEEMIRLSGAIYLNDSGVEIEGLKIWGSPVQPWFYDWAFNRQRGEDIKKHWDMIPDNTDILITHGPPYGILDQSIPNKSDHLGCEELLKAVDRVKPKLHIFGHIHGSAAYWYNGNGTHFFNASVLNEAYKPNGIPVPAVEL